MDFITFSSGSGGNAALLRSRGGTLVLLDAGISARRTLAALAALDLDARALSAILITHEHSDHVAGLRVLCGRCAAPVYASRGTAPALRGLVPEGRLVAFDAPGRFAVGDLAVTAFPTSHDARDPVGFRIDGDGGSFGLLTDTGVVPEGAEALCGVDTLLLEANHDPGMLDSGPYPYALKRRVAGAQGHLSNGAAADFALRAAQGGTREIVLAHLSKENNTPEAACYTVARRLQSEGYAVRLTVAPRESMSEVHQCRRSGLYAWES